MSRQLKQTKGFPVQPRKIGALGRFLKAFPHVKTIADATESIIVHVKPNDRENAVPKHFTNCPMARACAREYMCEGAFIGIGVGYLVFKRGTHAVRFMVPATVSREIAVVDRTKNGKRFADGTYRLSAVSKSHRFGFRGSRGGETGKSTFHTHRDIVRQKHETVEIRGTEP